MQHPVACNLVYVQPAHAAVHMQHHHLALNNRRKNYLETETTEASVLTRSLDVYTALCRVHSGEAHYSTLLQWSSADDPPGAENCCQANS